jgi:hypothetical protein
MEGVACPTRPCRVTGTVGERKTGSMPSLLQKVWTRPRRSWRPAADEVLEWRQPRAPRQVRVRPGLLRQLRHRAEAAVLRQDFALLIHLAMQEVCAATRLAAVARLTNERQAAMARLHERAAAEASSVRREVPGKERTERAKGQSRRRRYGIRKRIADSVDATATPRVRRPRPQSCPSERSGPERPRGPGRQRYRPWTRPAR